MPKESRVDRAEYLKRVDAILRIRLAGAQFHDVMQFVAEKQWGLKERQVRNLMRAADNLLAQNLQSSRPRIIALHFGRRELLYARALHEGDLRTALSVLRDSAELAGLYESEEKRATEKERQRGQNHRPVDNETLRRIAREAATAQRREDEAEDPQALFDSLRPPTE